MRTSTLIQLLRRFKQPSGKMLDKPEGENLRKQLAKLPPLQLLNLAFGHGTKHDAIRRLFSAIFEGWSWSRRDLLEWVYEDSRIYQDVNYVRLPSLAKRLLVARLVTESRSRFPWMNSRLLHAFAFRPEFFRQKIYTTTDKAWSGLYTVAHIPKGSQRSRKLLVPSPPLKQVQRTLLRTSFNRALEDLHSFVNGCRPYTSKTGLPYGIYRNAATHVGQEFVASFDVANFFPSISVDDIIPALMAIQQPMLFVNSEGVLSRELSNFLGLKNDSEFLAETLGISDNSKITELPWTQDAAVFVARLTTHRGRLVQGAPTSPAIANLVFHQHDGNIVDSLSPDVVYSRYVDDMTISISSAGARRNKIKSALEFRQFIEPVIKRCLMKTSFTLSERKTSVTKLTSGHKITGLHVGKTKVDLRREKKRQLRSLLYRLAKYGFLQTAMELVGNDIHSNTVLATAHSSKYRSDSRLTEHRLHGRKLSTENMAIPLIKHLYENLLVEVPERVLAIGSQRLPVPAELHKGKHALADIKKLLPSLWENHLLADDEDGHIVIRENDHITCRIRHPGSLDFFLLSKKEAISCIELFHRLRGLLDSLRVNSNDPCFHAVHNLHRQIASAISAIDIQAPKRASAKRARVVLSKGAPALTASEVFHNDAKRTLESIRSFQKFLEPVDNLSSNELENTFVTPADNLESLRNWLASARGLCVDMMDKAPSEGTFRDGHLMDALRLTQVLEERMKGERFPTYNVEIQFLKRTVSENSVDELADEDVRKVQLRLVELVNSAFEESAKELATLEGQADLQAGLLANDLRLSFQDRLDREWDRLKGLISSATWPDEIEMFHHDHPEIMIEKYQDFICPIKTGRSSMTVWFNLFKFCAALHEITIESLVEPGTALAEEQLESQEEPADDDPVPNSLRLLKKLASQGVSFLDTLFLMRCRASHGYAYSKKPKAVQKKFNDEWHRIQVLICKMLGRIKPKNIKDERKKFFEDDDIQLSAIEGSELKVSILQRLNNILENTSQRIQSK